MTSRLDRLLLLLDTGSSTSVRHTAAKQLAQIAVKSVGGDASVALEEDVKNPNSSGSTSTSNANTTSQSTASSSKLHFHGPTTSNGHHDPAAWSELMAVVAKILPYLHSKSHDTRSAASNALSHIFTLVPLWQPLPPPPNPNPKPEPSEADDVNNNTNFKQHPPPYPVFDLPTLLSPSSKLLLASSGKEFIIPAGILGSASEVKKARKEAMGRLGLEFLDNVADELVGEDDIDVDMEIVNPPPSAGGEGPPPGLKVKTEDIQPSTAGSSSRDSPMDVSAPSPMAPSPTPTTAVDDMPMDTSNMSARELNRLKRKRKVGNSAFVAAPPPSGPGARYNAAPAGNKARLVAPTAQASSSRVDGGPSSPSPISNNNGKVVVDPSKGSEGGAIAPTIQSSFKALEVPAGEWVWDGLVKVLEVDLFSPAWQVRHGAAMALRELIKMQGASGGKKDELSEEENGLAHEKWCNDLSAQFLCVFVLDRFGDFVSDQVVAPVRETVSQTLAALLLHMPRRSVLNVHNILLRMIKQDFVVPVAPEVAPPPPPPTTTKRRGRGGKVAVAVPVEPHKTKEKAGLVWEVRHAGLLGIKYEVAVRDDMFQLPRLVKSEVKAEAEEDGAMAVDISEADVDAGKAVLQDVVDAAVLGLGDRDDDVRAVAASCLLPVAEHIVKQLPESLERILLVLWGCLSDMKDDLSSSVGAVMDLLGKLVAYDNVIDILASDSVELPLTSLAPTLFPFFRHTIPNVRLAVVKTLNSFMAVPSLPRGWISTALLQLLFQNLIVEEREDIRAASLESWRMALSVIYSSSSVSQNGNKTSTSNSCCASMSELVQQQLVLDWYAVLMTPLGVPIDTKTFHKPTAGDAAVVGEERERHNVDKNMLSQDLGLISTDMIIKARASGATAMAQLMVFWPANAMSVDDMFQPFLGHYIDSSSMIQKLLSAIVAEEWVHEHEKTHPDSPALIDKSTLAQEVSRKTLEWLQSTPPAAYHEMAYSLARIHIDCMNLLQLFSTDCKLPASSIPNIGTDIDITGLKADEGAFTIETAQKASGQIFNRLKDSLGKTKRKELAVISEKRAKIVACIDGYLDLKNQHDVRISAAFAAAFVAFKSAPDKVSPIVKGIMNGIKMEENLNLQSRSAAAVASFIGFCSENHIASPPEKIVKNLCTFLCQDSTQTPAFALMKKEINGILSCTSLKGKSDHSGKDMPKEVEGVKLDDANQHLSRRGAVLAFQSLSAKFGSRILEVVPNMWQCMAGGLISTFSGDDSDKLIETKFGQDVIDSLSVLEAVVPTLHSDLWPKLTDLFPLLTSAVRSRFAIIRQLAARCFSRMCAVMTTQAMRYVIEHILPMLGDPLVLSNREGATELIYHVIQLLDIKALPYVIFLVVPVLGRMSDVSDDIRTTATNTFASLVKMVPLEAGLPDPVDFPEDLLKRRETEREFLMQLLDGSKVQQYDIPVTVKAELRKYQQDGVNWLAFLAKYQLHGILCDDMGLGKTLQSICILSSKHHERAQKHAETNSPESIKLPSLIVCPPTLTGHWYYEIQKYVDNLKPVLYVGNAKDRNRILGKVKQYDVVITSYEVVRNDIAGLEKIDWLYCILDEGHVIKNAKTKLTKAVKCIRAQHRLILSGTPIQNNVLELWSLFDFLMPGFLGTEHSFNERFGKPILANRDGKSKNAEGAALALEALHKQVLPFLLRRLKEDVLNDLPPKIIQDYYCDLSDMQKNLYDEFANSKALASAEGTLQSSEAPAPEKPNQHIFQSLQYLRKLCNHPALVLKDDAIAVKAALKKVGCEDGGLSDIQHAPKLLALKQLLNDCGIGVNSTVDSVKSELIDNVDESGGVISQHRVLIFCQMKQMLDIIETDLFKNRMPSVTYMRLDGGVESTKRHNIVQTFNSDPSIDCLLLTTHVGGLGLTLTGADTVIFVEHDWNPMKDLQAMDRAHRIGQKKVVNVYRLITKGTLEEKIMGLQRFKLNIANSVVTQQNSGLSSMDTDQVLDLFKRTSEEEDTAAAAKRKAKDESKPTSQKNVLQGLEDLPAEDEYQSLDLSSFMGSLGR